MRNKPTPKPKKRGRPPTTRAMKARPSITIDPDVLKKARQMAFDDGLALSTWLEQLVRGKLDGGAK
jgi:hypothetical protein